MKIASIFLVAFLCTFQTSAVELKPSNTDIISGVIDDVADIANGVVCLVDEVTGILLPNQDSSCYNDENTNDDCGDESPSSTAP
ncbi:hypothetical protein TcasGA2_TC034668 [Tribolium castaneum]|uniref:Secreted protein n=1 Tax=Tribolium castaneum TaxID=7070 RepID=A0A139WJA3_TRICA|nr:hypothetical protein TcasGA2_TC034668 [Tribolium castaneum]